MITSRRVAALVDDQPWWLAGGIPAANCIGAYRAVGAASEAASYVNLANPGTYNITNAGGTAVTWSSVGWNGQNTDKGAILTTGITSAHGWTIIARFSNCTDPGCLIGSYNYTAGGGLIIFAYNSTSDKVTYYVGTTSTPIAPQASSGVLCIAGGQCYRDGKLDTSNSGTVGAQNVAVTLFANYQVAAIVNSIVANCIIQCAAVYNNELTQTQVVELTARMNAL